MGAAASVILSPLIAAAVGGIAALISRLTSSPNHENQTNREIEEHLRRSEEENRRIEEERRRYEEEKRRREEEIRKQEEELKKKRQERERMEREVKEHRERMEREERERNAQREREEKERRQKEERERKAERERLQREFEQKQREEEEKRKRETERLQKENEQKQKEERERLEREHEQKQKEERERLQREHEQKQKEEREKMEREMREQERKQREEQEKMEREMREQAERVEREREEERLKMQQEQERMEAELRRQEEEQRAAEEELKRQHAEKEKLLNAHVKQLEKGISPKAWPTKEEWARAKGRLVGGPEKFHCAIAGNSGSGKSSLINALRGMRNNSRAAAEVGIVETTQEISCYADPSSAPPRNKFVWYDVPGAGTLTIPGPQYFNSQGLFVFDLIIVVVDNRFTTQDIAILQNCVYFKIPSFVVRSKANQNINNIIQEELEREEDSDWEDTEDGSQESKEKRRFEEAKEKLITKTRESFRRNMKDGELNPDQKVYIVSADGVRSLVSLSVGQALRGLKNPQFLIDEAELLQDLLNAIVARKCD